MQTTQIIGLKTFDSLTHDGAGEEPLFRDRRNNIGTLYVNDILADLPNQRAQITIGSDSQMMNGIKRFNVSRVLINEKTLCNIHSGNFHFVGVLTKPANPDIPVDVYIKRGRVETIEYLMEWLTHWITVAFPDLTFVLDPIFPSDRNTFLIQPINGYQFTPDLNCSFFKYGGSMFNPEKIAGPRNTIYCNPLFLPFWYLDFSSAELTKYSKNKNICTNNTVTNIIYRYYFGATNQNTSYVYNWNKTPISTFDLKITDSFNRNFLDNEYFINEGFCVMELTLDQ